MLEDKKIFSCSPNSIFIYQITDKTTFKYTKETNIRV